MLLRRSSVDELAYDAEISEMRSILYARAEEERQKAETRANASAARVVRMGEELRDCMGAAKVALHSVLTRLGAPMSVALPEADAKAFGAWLSEEVVSLKVVTQVVWDSGAYWGAFGLARAFQAVGCDHMACLGRPNHVFPSVDEVREADRLFSKIAMCFMKKFWYAGGRVLAAEHAARITAKVGLSFVEESL